MVGATARVPFVGRQRELSLLHHHLEIAGQGHGRIVLVGGEPGIGKTRLLLELGEHARSKGWLVLAGRAYESEGMPPYLPFTEALRDYVRTCPLEELQTQLGDGGAHVALAVHDLRARLPALASSPPLGAEQERYRLFESLTEFLLSIAHTARTVAQRQSAAPAPGSLFLPTLPGLLLILDDLHWADKPTLLLLQHLARRLGSTPLLLVGAYRTVELSREHPLTGVLADLTREALLDRLFLAPFTADEIVILIRELTGAAPAAVVLESIEHQTEGNPFFVGEVVQHLQADGRDLTAVSTAAVARSLPGGVREVIGQRLARMSTETSRMLQMAAVIGDRFSFEVLAKAAGAEEASLLDALDEAVAAGVLREEAISYAFSHALIRQTLYNDLSLARRQRMHLQAANAIEAVHADSLGEHAAALAVNYHLAGTAADVEKTLRYCLIAARQAVTLSAWEKAGEYYRTALELWPASPRSQAVERLTVTEEFAGIQVEMAETMSHTGDVPGSIKLLREALAHYEAVGDVADSLETRWKIVQVDNAANYDRADTRFVEASLAKVGETPSRLRALFLACKADLRAPECVSLAREAMAIAREVGDTQALMVTARRACRAAIWQARFDDAYPIAEALVQAAIESGDTYSQSIAFQELFHPLFHTSRLAEAKAAIDRGLVAALACRDQISILNCRAHAVLVHCFSGQWSRADELWAAEADHWVGAPERTAPHVMTYARWLRHLWAGNPASGYDVLRLVNTHDNAVSRIEAFSIKAQLELLDGRRAEASESLRNCLAGIVQYYNDFWRAQMAVTLSWVSLELGDQEACRQIEHILLPYKDFLLEFGLPSLELGRLAAARKQWAESGACFQTAARLAACGGLSPLLAETYLEWGRMLLARHHRGDLREARELIRKALTLHQDIGMHRSVAQDELLLAHRDLAAVPPSLPTYPDGLSQRQVEVLRLIAVGRSNAEIANELVLSIRTVERHIANIYEKIGIHGKSARAAATAYTLNRGLAAGTSPAIS